MGEESGIQGRLRRHRRVRIKISGSDTKPRLCVFRSLTHIYAQVIDDCAGHTIVSASTLDPEIRSQMKGQPKRVQAELVGMVVARRALESGIRQVVFDRGGYKYHGRVRALADGARQAGLHF